MRIKLVIIIEMRETFILQGYLKIDEQINIIQWISKTIFPFILFINLVIRAENY